MRLNDLLSILSKKVIFMRICIESVMIYSDNYRMHIEGHPITATRVRLAQFLGLCAGFDNCPLTDTCVINQLWQSLGRLNYAPNCRAHTHIIRCLLSHSSLSFFLTLPAGPAFNTKRCLKQQKSNLQHNCCHIIHQIWHKRKIALQWEEFGRAKGRGDTVP